jgi:hypothetical protein
MECSFGAKVYFSRTIHLKNCSTALTGLDLYAQTLLPLQVVTDDQQCTLAVEPCSTLNPRRILCCPPPCHAYSQVTQLVVRKHCVLTGHQSTTSASNPNSSTPQNLDKPSSVELDHGSADAFVAVALLLLLFCTAATHHISRYLSCLATTHDLLVMPVHMLNRTLDAEPLVLR